MKTLVLLCFFFLLWPALAPAEPTQTPPAIERTAEEAAAQGKAAIDAKDWPTAVASYTEAVAKDPTQAVYVIYLAVAYDGTGQFEAGEKMLTDKEASFTAPNVRQQMEIMLAALDQDWGIALMEKSDFPGALTHFQREYGRYGSLPTPLSPKDLAGKLRPAVSLILYCDLEGEQYDKTLQFYKQNAGVLGDPQDSLTDWFWLAAVGGAYAQLHQYPQAKFFLTQSLAVLQRFPNDRLDGTTSFFLAKTYNGLHQNAQALAYCRRALKAMQASGDSASQASVLSTMGDIYDSLNQYSQALDCDQQELALQRQKVHDPDGERQALEDLANCCNDNNQFEQAVMYSQQALSMARTLQNPLAQEVALLTLSAACFSLGRYGEATSQSQEGLQLARQQKDEQLQQVFLVLLGGISYFLKQDTPAIQYSQQVLTYSHTIKTQDAGMRIGGHNWTTIESVSLLILGAAYTDQGQYPKALEYLNRALALARQNGDREDQGIILEKVGDVYDRMKLPAQALTCAEQSLQIAREVKSSVDASEALEVLGNADRHLGRYGEAVQAHSQGLALAFQTKTLEDKARALTDLMDDYRALHQPAPAIFYGKQAVNAYQSLRANIQKLDLKTQKIYLAGHQDPYRQLVTLLIGQGRLPEAQQVLGLLKQQELTDLLRGEADTTGATGHVDLDPAEQTEEAQYEKIADQVTALGQQKQALLDQDRQAQAGGPAFTAGDQAKLTALTAQLAVATSHLQTFLTHLSADFRAPTPQNVSLSARLQAVKNAAGLQGTLWKLHKQGQDVVVLETVVAPDRYAVIVTTAQSQKVEQFPIKSEDLNKKVADLQAALRDPTADPRGPAHDLYTILIGPIEKDLAQAGAKTLMWSLDGTLRYVPIAALYDGHQYLVERFDNEVFTLGSQSGFGKDDTAKWTGLGLGVSLAHTDFNPLPAVPDELRGVIQDSAAPAGGGGVVPGTVLLDPQFTQASMTQALEEGKYNLVHIASHFALHPGDPDGSFLLLGDGAHLSLKQFADAATLFQDVDLLSLSACETATGGVGRDGSEVDGLGSIAQQDGAKSVLASLWPVSDASTRELMQTFYRWHETHAGVSKAEALRQAQLSLLHGGGVSPTGDAPHRGVDAVPSRAEGAALPPFVADPKAPYAHPFYWAPFILIGNWR